MNVGVKEKAPSVKEALALKKFEALRAKVPG
jgi:hypothetical protein